MVALLRSFAAAGRTMEPSGGVFVNLLRGQGLLHAVQDLLASAKFKPSSAAVRVPRFKQATSSTSCTRPSSLSITTWILTFTAHLPGWPGLAARSVTGGSGRR